VHIKKGYIEASDGYILARQKLDYEGEDVLIYAHELAKAQTSMSKDVVYVVQEDIIQATDNRNNDFVLAHPKETKFPETDNLFPTEKPSFTIRLDKDLLTRLLKSLPGKDLTFSFYSPTSQVKVEAVESDGLIMPMRLE
jgi:hypothetical protein